MNDLNREQLPLLCDDLSDDEYKIQDSSPTYQRRLFSPNSVRSRYHVKGAAAIIKHWPDHMSSLLTYWWMGLAMIGLTVFIIYNSVVAIATLPPQSRLNKMQSKLKLDDKAIEFSASYKTIYMHVIKNKNLSMDLNDYLPYIEIVAKNYPTFKYNFVILFNDTLENIDDSVNDFKKNEIALNSLWKEKKVDPKLITGKNIFIQRKSLTAFMNGSPLKKYWRHLPHKFMGFLIRCIAIWNKGGISVNPLLFTPKSPHPDYVDEIKTILKSIETPKISKKDFYKSTKKMKKKVNNIRDIINDLENDNSATDELQNKAISLAEEETRNIPTKVIINNTWVEPRSNSIEKNNIQLKDIRKKHNIPHKLSSKYKDLSNHSEKNIVQNIANVKDSHNFENKNNTTSNKNETTEQKLLPMFLQYIFSPTTNGRNTLYKSESDHALSKNIINNGLDGEILPDIAANNYAYPIKYLSKETDNLVSSESDQFLDLNLDLKGNMIATKTPCHAFLGTIFNNAIHHIKDKTVTDFIIAELSIFCKGTWTSCKGVNVIFL